MEDEDNDQVSWKVLGVVAVIAFGIVFGIIYAEYIQPESSNLENGQIDNQKDTNQQNMQERAESEEPETIPSSQEEKNGDNKEKQDEGPEGGYSDSWHGLGDTDFGEEGRFANSDFSWLNDENGGTKKGSESSSYSYSGSSSNPLEDSVRKIFSSVVGKTVNWDSNPRTLKEINLIEQYTWTDEKGGYLIEISYRANNNLTTKLTRQGILMDARDFAEELFRDSSCSEVNEYMLKPYLKLVDNYGNESEKQVAKIVLPRESAERIGNWDTIYIERFRDIVEKDGQLWLHQALRQ